MDISRQKQNNRTKNETKEFSFDVQIVKTMFNLRFKLITFMNTAHDLMCNQVIKKRILIQFKFYF